MDNYIERKDTIDYLVLNMGWHDEDGYEVDDATERRKIISSLISGVPAADAAPVRHLRRSDVYEPFYQFLGMTSASDYWVALRSLIDDLVEACGAKMDEEDTNENA